MKDFKSDLIGDDPEAAAFFADKPIEHRVVVKPYLQFYWLAWQRIKDDRHLDGWGGIGRMFYSTLSQYARDHGLTRVEFENFLVLMGAMDDEYLAWVGEQRAKQKSENPA